MGESLSQLRIIPPGKEVKLMKYTKPEIVVTENAVAAIQSMAKPTGNPDSTLQIPSTAAYESDE
jgi:hypothetical protein